MSCGTSGRGGARGERDTVLCYYGVVKSLAHGNDDPQQAPELEDQIRALTDRLTALERTVSRNGMPARPATGAVADDSAPEAPVGEPGDAVLRYSGEGHFGSHRLRVFRRADLQSVLDVDPGLVTREFAALASPVRLALLRALLDGPLTSLQLREELDAGSVGQLYHHLKDLLAAGLVIQPARNRYAIHPTKVVAVCVLIMAATHLAETSHQVPSPPPGPLADDEDPE